MITQKQHDKSMVNGIRCILNDDKNTMTINEIIDFISYGVSKKPKEVQRFKERLKQLCVTHLSDLCPELLEDK